MSKPVVAPSGAKSSFFGTNPMAFSWPRKNEMPVVFDQASAAMARGEIMIAAREGHKLPQGVGIDRFGKSSNDPGKILDGCQLPFGGYKGSSIAMMIELLSSGLIGEDFSYERGKNDNNDGGPTRGGELLIAINPNLFGDKNNWRDHSESFFNELLKLTNNHPKMIHLINNYNSDDKVLINCKFLDNILEKLKSKDILSIF